MQKSTPLGARPIVRTCQLNPLGTPNKEEISELKRSEVLHKTLAVVSSPTNPFTSSPPHSPTELGCMLGLGTKCTYYRHRFTEEQKSAVWALINNLPKEGPVEKKLFELACNAMNEELVPPAAKIPLQKIATATMQLNESLRDLQLSPFEFGFFIKGLFSTTTPRFSPENFDMYLYIFSLKKNTFEADDRFLDLFQNRIFRALEHVKDEMISNSPALLDALHGPISTSSVTDGSMMDVSGALALDDHFHPSSSPGNKDLGG